MESTRNDEGKEKKDDQDKEKWVSGEIVKRWLKEQEICDEVIEVVL